jgi:exosortase K
MRRAHDGFHLRRWGVWCWSRRGEGGVAVLALALVYALKRHYSTATTDDLLWIMAPTRLLVEWMSGLEFVLEPAGYVSTSAALTITPGCAGVNFLAICGLSLVFALPPQPGSVGRRLAWFPLGLGLAYLLTLVANALRIVVAWQWRVHTGHVDHLELGVVVYLTVLCSAHLMIARRSGRTEAAGTAPRRMTGASALAEIPSSRAASEAACQV